MLLFTETNLSETLRKKCDGAKSRIWVVSPFVGDAKDIECILGANWKNKKVDRKLLFDAISGSMSKDTLGLFIDNDIQVKSLHSVHAKVYIVDDWCLVSSANLTGAAFSKRYEIGTTIESKDDVDTLVDAFCKWWDLAEAISKENHINEIKTNNNFKQIHDLPQKDTNQNLYIHKRPRKLHDGEYRVNGVNLVNRTVSGRKCLLLNCKTTNRLHDAASFVAIYDPEIIKQYERYLWINGKSSLNYDQCEDLPDELRYISYMKKKVFDFDHKHPYVRRFVKDVSRGTYGSYLDDYDGWEYECAMSQPPPPTGIWWVDKAEEEEWERNPFPSEAYPATHYYIETFICTKNNSDEVSDSVFEKIRNYTIEDFYSEFSPREFPDRKNRMH